MPNSKTAILIPARGGSKGIPRKNMQRVGGRSLVERAVLTAIAADVGEVFVSTDDAEISKVATMAGAFVISRPKELASDQASSESVVMHALPMMGAEHVIMMQCTSPFTTTEHIRAVAAGTSEDYSAHTVARFHGFLWDGAASRWPVPHDTQPRRQDAPRIDRETGALYGAHVSTWEQGRRFTADTRRVVVPPARAVEIDDECDLQVCRALAPTLDRECPWLRRIQSPSAVVLDFDGVLSDNQVWTGPDGQEYVSGSKEDSAGIMRLKEAGIPMVVLTHETNGSVAARCRKLELECCQTCEPKHERIAALVGSLDRVVYVGNDRADLGCMALVGYPVAVGDARAEVKAAAAIVLDKRGGHGAVRELAEMILGG